jgi:hypothetical protein
MLNISTDASSNILFRHLHVGSVKVFQFVVNAAVDDIFSLLSSNGENKIYCFRSRRWQDEVAQCFFLYQFVSRKMTGMT